jgi:TRAP-type C4-dicarboxylate transport system substrate-binding protein
VKNVRFLVLVFLVVVCIGTLLAGCTPKTASAPAPATSAAPAAKPITLVFSFHDPETNAQNTGLFVPWFKMIEQRTNGRVTFEAHYNSELVNVMDAYDATVKGTIDIGVILPSTQAQFPLDEIVASPQYDVFSWRLARVYNELYQKYPALQAEYSQVKPLILYAMSPGFLGTSKKPVSTLGDCAGLKMITADQFSSQRAQALGEVPVSTPPPEFYSTIEKGIADGGDVVTLPEMITYKWADIIKNITLLPCLRNASAVIMNKQKWDSLPPDIQKIINDSIPEAVDLADRSQILAYKDAVARLPKDFGTNIITLSPGEMAKFVAADKPVRDAFIASLNAKNLPATQIDADCLALSQKYATSEYDINP